MYVEKKIFKNKVQKQAQTQNFCVFDALLTDQNRFTGLIIVGFFILFYADFYAIKHKGTQMCHGIAYFYFDVFAVDDGNGPDVNVRRIAASRRYFQKSSPVSLSLCSRSTCATQRSASSNIHTAL